VLWVNDQDGAPVYRARDRLVRLCSCYANRRQTSWDPRSGQPSLPTHKTQ